MAGRFPPVLLPPTRPLAAAYLAAVVLIAYLPSLFGGFVYDDQRFVEENAAVHHLSVANVGRYFSDPSTMAATSWKGIYRPLRTLDFAIDWAIGGGSPFFFHLRNLIYHALVAWLVFCLLRRLLPESDEAVPAAAFLGALVFALHPVQTESVAWITSRGDLLVGVFFLAALLLHLRGRFVLAALVLVAALFSKESAAVFAGAAFLADRLRRRPPPWIAYGVYLVIAGAYAALWVKMIAGGDVGGVGHVETFWGGSYVANLLTMAGGFLHYARLILFPVHFTVDTYVPIHTGFSGGAVAAAVVLLAIAGAMLLGRRSRFALGWFLVTILPVSNLLFPIGIPTAERFLYVPLVGIVLLAAPALARTRLTLVVLGCLALVTFRQCFFWKDPDALFEHALEVTESPRALGHYVDRSLDRAYAAQDRIPLVLPGERPELVREMQDHAAEAVRYANRLVRFYRDHLHEKELPASAANSLSQQANAYLLLGRWAAALRSADLALRARKDLPDAFYNAGYALWQLGRKEEAALNFQRSAELSEKAARELEALGQVDRARQARAEAERARSAAQQLSGGR